MKRVGQLITTAKNTRMLKEGLKTFIPKLKILDIELLHYYDDCQEFRVVAEFSEFDSVDLPCKSKSLPRYVLSWKPDDPFWRAEKVSTLDDDYL